MSQNRLKSLFDAVEGVDNLLILPHNDPDPDAIASAVALRFLLVEKAGIEAKVAYHGIVGRAENKALVSYLDYPLQSLASMSPSKPTLVAFVDTQPGAGNNLLPPEAVVIIVIDHHPWRQETVQARFFDVPTGVGAASTILTEYLQIAGIEPNQKLATALFYGIKTDTLCLSRGTSSADMAAYTYLQPLVDVNALTEIERAQVPVDYFKSFDATLRATRLYDRLAVSYIGSMAYPDLTAEMADILLRLEGCEWVICMGVYQGQFILSVRTRSRQGGAGRLVQAVVGSQGTAGGHSAMAGGHISLNGRDPRRLAGRIRQHALQHLSIPIETKGQSLV